MDSVETWTLQNNGLESLVSDDKIYQISQSPLNSEQFAIATTKGVFTSTDHGNTWTQVSNTEVQSIKHSDSNLNHMVAITYDAEFTSYKIAYTNDSGFTWNEIPTEDLLYLNSDNQSSVIDFNGDNADIYIGTYDLGVIKYTINLNTLSNPIFNSETQIVIAPNPVQNILKIQTKDKIKEVAVYDMLGNKVTVNQLSTNSFDISHLASGMYLIKLKDENEKTFSKKFMKE